MTDNNRLTDLTGGLDLLGDWLDAKGYTEEAGLCTRVMDFMHEQAERISKLEKRDKMWRIALDQTGEHE